MTMEAENGGARIENLLRLAAWGGAALLFLLPVAAEQLTAEMDWTAFDFGFWAGVLLVGCGAFELVMRRSRNWAYRAGAFLAIGAAFALFIACGAVGVIGSEDHPANLLYLGVLAMGLGAAVAGGRPEGLARALIAMAVAQVLIGVATITGRWGADEAANWLAVAVLANGVWAAAWLVSAGLFRRAARQQGSTAAAA